ncbi:MAG: tRNA (guanosine(37)-N1)-methyltransferase TrmD [Acidobacteria bacterium]|nr:tRNA (guanosine(37)-N1)-methyltransferase TrmD [Acidobacteriota bacterium]
MRIDIITIFPDLFSRVFDFGMIQQARERHLLEIKLVDLRQFAEDKHRTVDDRIYGGGSGMVLKPEPIFKAVESCASPGQKAHVVLLSPQGTRFDQEKAKQFSLRDHLILICGRYEGVDQRVADFLADEEISIGDFVLSGGEFAALVITDAVSRLLPGVVGKGDAVLEESFMEDLLDYPSYTRPAEFRGMKVPEILLSGNHEQIQRWREEERLRRTQERRPDLLEIGKGSRTKK